MVIEKYVDCVSSELLLEWFGEMIGIDDVTISKSYNYVHTHEHLTSILALWHHV